MWKDGSRLGAYPTHVCDEPAPDARPDAHMTHRDVEQAPGTRFSACSTHACAKPASRDTPRCLFDARVRRTSTKGRASVRIRHPYATNPHRGACFAAYPTNIRGEPAVGNPIQRVSDVRMRPRPVTHLPRHSPWNCKCAVSIEAGSRDARFSPAPRRRVASCDSGTLGAEYRDEGDEEKGGAQ